SLGNDDDSKWKARDAWAKWLLEHDGPGLVQELEKRTLSDEKMAQVNGLIEKLGDKALAVRDRAEADLKKMGPGILPLLRAALKGGDLEIRKRALKLVKALEPNAKKPLSPTVLRLIGLRKPRGAAEALLAYVPFAEDEAQLEEVQKALDALTFFTGTG